MEHDRDPYLVLQVAPTADDFVIAAAYRALARRYHPDVSMDETTSARMAEINAAWAVLGNPERRAAYDRSTGRAPGTGSAPTSRQPSSHGSHASGFSGHGAAATGGPRNGQAGNGSANGQAGNGQAGNGSANGQAGNGQAGSPSWGTGPSWSPGSVTGTPSSGGRPQWRRGPDGEGSAGPPPGRPSGSVLPFGRHVGWSIGEIMRVDPGYLEWLLPRPEAAPFREEIERAIGGIGWRQAPRRPDPNLGGAFSRLRR